MGRRARGTLVLALVVLAGLGGGSASATPAFSLTTSFHYRMPFGFPSIRSLAVGDLNGDGRQDLVVAGFNGNLAIFLNDGDGGFQPPSFLAGQCPNAGAIDGAAGVAIGFFASNGYPAILVGCDWYLDGFVRYAGNGDGTFQAPVRIAPIQEYLGENDQRQQVFGGVGLSNMVHGSFGGTNAVAWDEWSFGGNGGAAVLCMTRDVDIAAGSNGTACSNTIVDGTLTSSLQFGPPVVLGSWSLTTPTTWAFTMASPGSGMTSGSLLGALYDGTPPTPLTAGFASLYFVPLVPLDPAPSLLGSGDLNGDGTTELLAQAGTDGDHLAVYDIAGGVDILGSVLIQTPPLYQTAPALEGMYGTAVADFDGDGHPDVAVLGESNSTSSTYLELARGDGSGGLGSFQAFQVADFASDSYLTSGDFNNDGHTDLVTAVGDELTLLLDTPPTPTITSFSPHFGGIGTTVTVTGTHLDGATSVRLHGTSASFTQLSSTQVSFTVPAGATSGTISVTTANGIGTSSGWFGVLQAPPHISTFSPAHGSAGATITITGKNFVAPSVVSFNGAPAAFSVLSSNTITATVPGGATSGPITVQTPYGTATSAGTFVVGTPLVPIPSITSFAPAAGPRGRRVYIHGTGLSGATGVTFNGRPAGFTVLSDKQIATNVPAGATTGHISVTTPGGTAGSPGVFTVL